MALPAGVHEKHGRYYLVHRDKGERKWIPLTRVSEGIDRLMEAIWSISTLSIPLTVGALLTAYNTKGTTDLAEPTRLEYARIIRARLSPVFGKMPIAKLKPSHVARYLEEGRMAGRSTLTNRERAVLSSAYEWGMRKGYCESNPCRGIRRNKERPSRVYVSDEQFLDAYRRAAQCVRNLMYVGYLTGLRLVDLCRLRKDWITRQGIELEESKTGHRRLIEMTPYLRLALDRALDYAPDNVPYVLVAARGQRWQDWAVQSAWKRLAPGFPFRAIRAKAATDAAAEGRNTLGHHGQMLTRYVRRERLRPVA